MIDLSHTRAIFLQMVQLTLSEGLCPFAPLAFAIFSAVILAPGDEALSYRVGTLALMLLDKVNALAHTWGASIHLGYLSQYYQLQSRTCSAQFQAGSLVIRFPSQPTTGAEIINGTSRTIS